MSGGQGGEKLPKKVGKKVAQCPCDQASCAVSAEWRLLKLGFCPLSEGKSAWETEALFSLSDYISKEWFSGP